MKENLQAVLVSKRAAKTRTAAERMARPYVSSIRAPREREDSWVFEEQPSSRFAKGSFRVSPIQAAPGIALVHGKLKRSSNPSGQRHLQFRSGDHRTRVISEWDFLETWRSDLGRIKSPQGLMRKLQEADDREIKSPLILSFIESDIADLARKVGFTKMKKTIANDERIVRLIRQGRLENPYSPPTKKKATKKKVKRSSSIKAQKLRSPKHMPDPGPCAWLGSVVEWGWKMNVGEKWPTLDEHGNAIWSPNQEWMFMWSPKYKAIVSVRTPRNMYKRADVSRHGGAAKMFEVFMDRPAENTFEMVVPDVKLHKVGSKASLIVYRSDKWSPKRIPSDYIHCLGKGVELYCGPSLKNPQVFLCFGGKLTMTKRGLVW